MVRTPPAATITSDTSGSWECGPWGEWLQYEWPEQWKSVHITVKELLPVMGIIGGADNGR